jgi:ATP-dependent RNA helicase DDX56/DBP9
LSPCTDKKVEAGTLSRSGAELDFIVDIYNNKTSQPQLNMKRKLNDNDVPVPVAGEEEKSAKEPKSKKITSFTSLGLDARLLQATAKLNFETPTLVQQKTIPLAINGKDILARAKTGSGKTAAYLLPIIHSILKRKEVR